MNTNAAVRLSVGVPAYNQGRFLGETIESLLRQTVPPLEIVVSENHSTDETPQVLRQFGDRIRVVRPDRHLPMMAHWNFLVSQLRGDWVALLSSDDVALPVYVETLLRAVARHDRSVLVRCGYQRMDGDGRILEDIRFRHVREVTSPPDTLRELLRGCLVSLAAFALRRDAWQTAGGFPEDFHLMGDWALWLRCSPLGDFLLDRTLISRYRLNYRTPEQEKRWAPLWAEDTRRLFCSVIPPLATRLRVAGEEIAMAQRRACYSRLADASRVLGPGERDQVADILADWARRCGLDAALRRFRDGRTLPRRDYGPIRRAFSGISRGYQRIVRRVRQTRRSRAGTVGTGPRDG